jgi:RNA polymerase sigma factor (sigma-70 family)
VSSAAPDKTAEPTGLHPEKRAAPIGGPPAGEWEDIYATNVVPVYRFVYAKTGNRADAEELTSQVFLQALPHLRVGVAEEARAYLLATARTQLANYWRTRYRVVAEPMDDVASPAADVTGSDDAERRIHSLLVQLPIRYRRVLELRFLRGLSIRETAKEMGITVGNTKVIQLRALRRTAELGAGAPLIQS